MPVEQESGVRIEFPDENFFRFARLQTYVRLSGRHLKEMDFGWWDDHAGRLWLIEVKGEEIWPPEPQSGELQWPGPPPAEPLGCAAKLTHTLLLKAVDSLLMLSSMWCNTDEGVALRNDFSEPLAAHLRDYPGCGRIRLMFVLSTPRQRHELMGALSDQLNALLQGRLRLFGIRRATVVDVERAAEVVERAGSRLRILSE